MAVNLEAYAAACAATELAAFDGTQWSQAVHHLAMATGSRAAELIGVASRSHVPLHVIADHNLDPDALVRYWHAVEGASPAVNPMIRAGLALPAMCPILDHELVSIDRRARHVLWNEVFDPFDIPHIGSIVVHKSGPEHLVIGVLRSRAEGPLLGDAHALLADFSRRVKKSAAISRCLGAESARLLTGGLDAVSAAAIAISGWGLVVGVTEAAERLIACTRALRIEGRRLGATNREVDAQLRTALAAAARGGAGEVHVPHGPGRRLRLSIHPLQAALQLGFGTRVLVTLRDEPAIDHLTPAERAVLAHLAQGRSIGEISQRRNVSRETVKTQAKVVYAKLGVSGKVDIATVFRDLPDGLF